MNINLLPWRELKRQVEKKRFINILALTAGLTLLLVVIIHFLISMQLNYQRSRNAYLSGELSIFDRKIREISTLKEKQEELLARMQVIQGLQGNRPVIVRVFDNLVRLIPKGVHLDSLIMKGKTLTIKGVAENNNNISALMRNLDNSEWFDDSRLTAVKALDIGDGSMFNLSVGQIMPGTEGKR